VVGRKLKDLGRKAGSREFVGKRKWLRQSQGSEDAECGVWRCGIAGVASAQRVIT
jgi:hypothetical protein